MGANIDLAVEWGHTTSSEVDLMLSLSGTARCTASICDFGSSGPLSGLNSKIRLSSAGGGRNDTTTLATSHRDILAGNCHSALRPFAAVTLNNSDAKSRWARSLVHLFKKLFGRCEVTLVRVQCCCDQRGESKLG
jgi:hypothetical protein